MTDSYLQNQNISNNILLNNPNYNQKFQNQINKKDMNENYSSSDEDKNETIDIKFNDSSSSLEIVEVPQQKEDITSFQQLNKEYNDILQKKNRNNSEINLNKNRLNFSEKDKKDNTTQRHLNRAISGNILPLHKNTNIVLGNIKINFERAGYKPSISEERNTLKQTESRFSSSSENKYKFINRKTVSNKISEIKNNIYNKINPSFQSNNIFINNKNISKIDKEPKDNIKKINKNNKDNNKYNLTYNNYYGNINSYINLSPTLTNPKDNVKKEIKKNLDDPKNESVKSFINQNNNMKERNLNENTKLIINNIKIINSFGNKSPKRNKSNLKQKNINDSLSNFGLSERNNSLDYLVNNNNNTFINEINTNIFKKLDISNQQRSTNEPKDLGNIHFNKNQNNMQRLTVPYRISSDRDKNYQNQIFGKNNLIQNKQNMQLNQKIFFNPNLKKINIKSKSPNLSNIKKIPTLNKINNFNTFNQIKEKLTNQINRHCISPDNSNLEQQTINNIINKQINDEQKNIKKININKMYNNFPNINNEINSMKTIYKFNTSNNNIIKNFNNINNNLNNLDKNNNIKNSFQIKNMDNTLNSNNLKNNDKENLNNSKKFNFINKMNTNIIINNKKVLNSINQNKNNISRNPNIKNDLQNINVLYKTNPQKQNYFEQKRNTLSFNNNSKIISKIKNQNINLENKPYYIPQRITSISLENLRLTQIPINSKEINNIIFSQKEISNHLQDKNYFSNQNKIYLYNNENQFFNKTQNNNKINKDIIMDQNILNELINKKDADITYNKFDASGWIKNYGILTLPGKDTSGNQKTNQDSFVFKTNINNIKNFNIFGVLDGHGPDGHYVSKFASEFIPSLLSNHPEIKHLLDPDKIYKKLKDNNYKIITKTFIETDNQLKKASFDSTESGCTCSLIINIGHHIICANTGDSRAIVVFNETIENNINLFKSLPLSIDYKPEIPEETKRILEHGGEVRQMKNELGEYIGPYRVWAKNGDYPGLAMSRSIGDLKGKNIGIIPDPGILEYDLSEKTKYIVVCSDGVWEFLENEIVKDIGKKYYIDNNPSGFCHELVSQSLNLWEKNDIVVDDITAVVVFF